MSKYSRTKGHSFERYLANFLRERFPGRDVRRTMQAHRAWEADVVMDAPVQANLCTVDRQDPSRLWFECNSSARPNVFEKLAQAVKDAEGKNRIPCVVAKKTHGETVVVMRLEDFAKWSGWELRAWVLSGG